jgi:hypothetical protein
MWKGSLTISSTLFLFIQLTVGGCSSKENKVESTKVISTQKKVTKGTAISIYRWHRNLSKEFDIELNFQWSGQQQYDDTSQVRLHLWDKSGSRILDSILLTTGYYFNSVFTDSNKVSSYSTKVHFEEEGWDNHFGDIVIADINFDGKDDIAIMKDGASNGGATYIFYTQEEKCSFSLNSYLTDTMRSFPSKIDKANRQLTTLVRASAVSVGEHVYQLKGSKWFEKSHRFIRY